MRLQQVANIIPRKYCVLECVRSWGRFHDRAKLNQNRQNCDVSKKKPTYSTEILSTKQIQLNEAPCNSAFPRALGVPQAHCQTVFPTSPLQTVMATDLKDFVKLNVTTKTVIFRKEVNVFYGNVGNNLTKSRTSEAFKPTVNLYFPRAHYCKPC